MTGSALHSATAGTRRRLSIGCLKPERELHDEGRDVALMPWAQPRLALLSCVLREEGTWTTVLHKEGVKILFDYAQDAVS